MNRQAMNILGCLHERFGKRWMGMDHLPKLLSGRTHLHGKSSFMDKVRSMGAAQMHAQYLVRIGLGNDLGDPRYLSHGMCLSEPAKREPADPVLDPLFPCLLLPHADAADFRHGENACRNDRIIHNSIASQRIFRGNEPLVRGDMGKHDSTGDITYGIDAGHVRFHAIIHNDLSAAAFVHSPGLKADIL